MPVLVQWMEDLAPSAHAGKPLHGGGDSIQWIDGGDIAEELIWHRKADLSERYFGSPQRAG